MRLHRVFLFAFALVLTNANLAAAQGLAWDGYENPRFGYRVLYPSGLFRNATESANGDGSTFTSVDGRSKFTVFAAYNEEHIGIEQYRATIINQFPVMIRSTTARLAEPGLSSPASGVAAFITRRCFSPAADARSTRFRSLTRSNKSGHLTRSSRA